MKGATTLKSHRCIVFDKHMQLWLSKDSTSIPNNLKEIQLTIGTGSSKYTSGYYPFIVLISIPK